VERTPENKHFFKDNKSANRLEIIKQGSAQIVSLLRMNEQAKQANDIGPGQLELFAAPRQLAFFDRQGTFHDGVLLKVLEPTETDSQKPGVKHTAIFEPTATPEEVLSIPVDDIHCLSLASLRSVTSRKFIDDI
jgi:hypothetical protein